MELIHPAEISGKIMTLIDQATTDFTIVSLYNKLANWKKLTQRLKNVQDRGVKIRWYIRKNVEQNTEELRSIGIKPIEVENLHCKLYLNEKHAVVTSMNLHEYSDSSSIDIGYLVTEVEKYKELVNFIEVYIDRSIKDSLHIISKKPNDPNHATIKEFMELIHSFLVHEGYDEQFIKVSGNRHGKVVSVYSFLKRFTLILEPWSGYFRIDLRINHDYKTRKEIYDWIYERREELIEALGFSISFGSQMKRLKIDLHQWEHYRYEEWNIEEFQILKPILEKVLKVYQHYLPEALAHIE